MRSASIHRPLMQRLHIPGTFAITATEYGTWHEREEANVHFLHAIAASVSILVFESQSHILNILWEVLIHLADGLSFSPAGQSGQDRMDQNGHS